MNWKKARQLRREAEQRASKDYGTTNTKVDLKTRTNGKLVMNDRGAMVPEQVPVVTYTTVLNDGCSRKVYKTLKREGGCDDC